MESLGGTRPVAYQVVDVGIETYTLAIGGDTVSQYILEDLVLLIIWAIHLGEVFFDLIIPIAEGI